MGLGLTMASCAIKKRCDFDAIGSLYGQQINLKVDHIVAKQMIEGNFSFESICLDDSLLMPELTTQALTAITYKYSLDVATTYFLQRTFADNKSSDLIYEEMLYKLKSGEIPSELNKLRNYTVLFVPGLAYNADTSTGANFARQRKLLDSYGIRNRLVNTLEWGLCNFNAKLVAHEIRKNVDEKIILVSASKGSIEAHEALTEILDSTEIKKVHSWISVGGILNGSPIADKYLKFPHSWFAQIMLAFKGVNSDLVEDLSYVKRTAGIKNRPLPAALKVIHFIGVPFSLNVRNEVRGRYNYLKYLGPNDGLTPLAEQLLPNGIVICEVGLDHYFRSSSIDLKTIALGCLAVTDNSKSNK